MFFFLFLCGLCLGSFVMTSVDRFVKKKDFFTKRSYCFSCKKQLKFYELIPLFSYLFLHTRCLDCKSKISFLYPLVEILSAFLLIFAYVFSGNLYEFLFLGLYLLGFLALSLIDYKLKAVPEILLWFVFICAGFFAFKEEEIINLFLFEDFKEGFLLCSLVFCGVIFFLKSFVSCLINYKKQGEILESLGEADVIIIASMGGILGFNFGIISIFLACILSLPFFLILKFKKCKDQSLAMFPFLNIAFILVFACKMIGNF
ncbi:A24 family peptidase [Campylobacter sp. US33a]|uniref:prepilin peptidase n=1 Tax=Campylobacter sp. US33a TaxID=2498120 RepID=UPI001068A833|nr:prepilin peptidase [Campylobacter sp. US33a]